MKQDFNIIIVHFLKELAWNQKICREIVIVEKLL